MCVSRKSNPDVLHLRHLIRVVLSILFQNESVSENWWNKAWGGGEGFPTKQWIKLWRPRVCRYIALFKKILFKRETILVNIRKCFTMLSRSGITCSWIQFPWLAMSAERRNRIRYFRKIQRLFLVFSRQRKCRLSKEGMLSIFWWDPYQIYTYRFLAKKSASMKNTDTRKQRRNTMTTDYIGENKKESLRN